VRSCDTSPVRHMSPARQVFLLLLLLLFCAFAHAAASGQTGRAPAPAQRDEQQPTVIFPDERRQPVPAALPSEAACSGFIEQAPQGSSGQIVGAEEERERRVFSEGDLVFVDAGAQGGLRVGQEFTVVRPRGRFQSKFSRKSGSLGVYTQEVGRLRVERVRDRVSVARVTAACGDLLLGDLLRPAANRAVPQARPEVSLDRFAEPTGKQTGRIVLAREGREMVTRDQIVFIDLGNEDGVKAGDYLTVFRPEDHGTIVKFGNEIAANARRDFQSDEFRGGEHSNQAQRVEDVDGSRYGETVKTPSIKRRRTAVPRKVVGEIVVLHVEGRTATAIVTRVAQEIHTGDAVEVQ